MIKYVLAQIIVYRLCSVAKQIGGSTYVLFGNPYNLVSHLLIPKYNDVVKF